VRQSLIGLLTLLAFCCVSGCADPGGLHVEGPAPDPAASARRVLVLDYASHPAQRPRTLWLDEVRVVVRLRWSAWGGARATATGTLLLSSCGKVSCPNQSRSDTVPARLVLDGQVLRADARYYRHAAIVPTGRAARFWPVDPGGVYLPVPAP
jgi:hypothetical protein